MLRNQSRVPRLVVPQNIVDDAHLSGRCSMWRLMPRPTKELQRIYQRDWMRKRRQAWLKLNGPCRQCGSTERLEVDHIDPKQKVTHAVWSWGTAKRMAELNKCQVLCFTCHRKKSNMEYSARFPLVHGTRSGYETHGCRCDRCTEVASARSAKYRKR